MTAIAAEQTTLFIFERDNFLSLIEPSLRVFEQVASSNFQPGEAGGLELC
jgi:hypothetical protein